MSEEGTDTTVANDHGVSGKGQHDAESSSLADLSVPERVLVALVQDPIRGFVVVVLLLIAFSFLVALAFVYPLVALVFFLLLFLVTGGFVGYAVWHLLQRK